MKFKKEKFFYYFLGITSLLIFPNPINSNPSSYFEEKQQCIENPDFITPITKKFKYCIRENGIIKKYDEFDNLVELDVKLNQLVDKKVVKETPKVNKKKVIRSPLRELIEYKLDDEELFKYSCEAKREKGKSICKNKSKKELIGIRPSGFYLKKGLTEIENKTDNCNLGLKEGVYEIVVTNAKESFKFERKVK